MPVLYYKEKENEVGIGAERNRLGDEQRRYFRESY